MKCRLVGGVVAGALILVSCGNGPTNVNPCEGAAGPTQPLAHFAPEWSPDGEWIVFAEHFTVGASIVGVVRASGDSIATFVGSGAFASWSPDGSMICVASHDGIRLFEWSPGVATETRLLETAGLPIYVEWSPDGSRLVYDVLSPADSAGIWVTQVQDGAKRKRITPVGTRGRSPTWGPESRDVFFAWYREDGKMALFSVPSDGGELTEIHGTSGRTVSAVEVAPDGSAVLLIIDAQVEVFLFGSATGSSVTDCVAGSDLRGASWHPQMTHVVYNQDYLFVVDLSDGSHRQVTDRRFWTVEPH